MPLSKRKNRDRMRALRATYMQPKVVQPATREALQQMIRGIEARQRESPKGSIPLYNPAIHKAGDTVLVQQGKRLIPTKIPELDADGRPMPEWR